jgi:hypothetical protein
MDFEKRTIKNPWWADKMVGVGPKLQVTLRNNKREDKRRENEL